MQQETTNPFDGEAERYDLWFESPEGSVIFEIEKDCLRGLIQNDTGLWLEIGVGSGRFASSLGVSEGIDPSWAMLAAATQRGVHVVQGIGEQLPYRNGSFDGVLIVTTLCFLTDPKKTLAECRRVLVRTGVLVAAIVPAQSPWGQLYMRKGHEGHPVYSRARFYTCQQVVGICAEAGFGFEKAMSCLQTPPGEYPMAEPEEGVNESAGFVAMRFQRTRIG